MPVGPASSRASCENWTTALPMRSSMLHTALTHDGWAVDVVDDSGPLAARCSG